jgi:hypothetical protein
MRVDNHMAGYRPPPPKSKNKGAASSGLLSAGFLPNRANRSSLPQDDGPREEDASRDSARQMVHKRNKLEQAAYALTTGDTL